MRSILFDFGGTLDYPRHWLDRFLAHYRAAGINLTRAELDHGFDHATRIAYRSTRALAGYGLVELVDYLVRLQIGFLGRHGSEELRENLAAAAGGMRLDEVAGWITQSFVAESRQGFAISREVLGALSGRFRMGVVSNFYGNLENILAEADLKRFFGAIADSSRIGIFKPEPGLFIAALEQLGALPAETAMVGDSLSKDCVPARKLGITAIWLGHSDANGANEGAADGVADFTIDTLAGLEHLKWYRD
ncbi:MAG: HAD family hydrolase [Candidatus Binataceae bacterium]|jgi:putative hydrolase of the HAD superfamily